MKPCLSSWAAPLRLILAGWCICAALPAPLQAGEIYKLEVSSVQARAIAPSESRPAVYTSLSAAQAAMLNVGAQRAVFSFKFKPPLDLCGGEPSGIYLGVVYDQDRVSRNGELIGITADPEHVSFRKTNSPRLYLLPKRLLSCARENLLEVDARSLVGRRLGPLGKEILVGPWWRLEIIRDRLGEYLLFFREIGFIILSITLVLVSLFWRYSLNRSQMAFASFAFWSGLMCVSLSGWLFSLIGHPVLLYALHAALVCVMLLEFNRLLALYAETGIFPKVAHFWSGIIALMLFCYAFIYLPPKSMLLIYKLILLAYIVNSITLLSYAYILHGFRGRSLQGMLLWLVVAGVFSDTVRILGLHSGPNISAYLIAVSVIGLGLIFASELVDVFKMAAATQRMQYEKDRFEVLSNLARQVAHDIRSPLAALDSMAKDISGLPEERRLILRAAMGRIRDIANDLIEKNDQFSKMSIEGAEASSKVPESARPQLLSSLIESVVTEKRMQFRSRIDVEIDARFGNASYGLFAKVQPVEFKRALSNIINNAVEAMHGSGSVILEMTHRNGKVSILVRDTGKGIPADTLLRLGRSGETHDKAGGSGLGLYHAKSMIEACGGAIEISSEVGKGTLVEIKIPQAPVPSWFFSELLLDSGDVVVVLDDDTTIHRVWTGRFESLRAREKNVELLHFSTPGDFRAWAAADPSSAKKAIYLLDYELSGYSETGLTLAEELKLGDRAALVTSRYEEKHVLDQCVRLGMRMMPKGLAGLIPITINNLSNTIAPPLSGRNCAVLLDDDMLVHMNWKLAAKAAGVELKTYKTPEDFAAGIHPLPKDTPIYIDSDLGNYIKGEDIAKIQHEKGFTDITMATGHEPEKFSDLPWIKVCGKEPPWA